MWCHMRMDTYKHLSKKTNDHHSLGIFLLLYCRVKWWRQTFTRRLTSSCSVQVLTSWLWLLEYWSRLFSCWMIRLTSFSSLLKKRSSCPAPNAVLAVLESWSGNEVYVCYRKKYRTKHSSTHPSLPKYYRACRFQHILIFSVQYTEYCLAIITS